MADRRPNDAPMTLKEAMRETGLTRRQLRYLEQREHLGFVQRSNGRTTYTPGQSEFLRTFARLRTLGLSIEEAAQIATECLGGELRTAPARLLALAAEALGHVERQSRTAADLLAVRGRSEGPATPAGASPAASP